MTKQSVREAAAGRWLEILTRCGLDARLLVNTHGPCPGCGGRDRFRFDDLGRNGTFICSQGSGDLLVGDGFRLLEHARGWDWRRAIAEVAALVGLGAGQIEYREKQRDGVTPAPLPTAPDFSLSMTAVEDLTRGTPTVNEDWLRRRSAIDPEGVTAGGFLDVLYEPGERALVFLDHRSQGDFLWVAGGAGAEVKAGGYRLAQERGVKAVRSRLPAGGSQGVWFLTQPVTGQWAINPKVSLDQAPAKWTRRSECNVTAWRYYVLESDELAAELWLRVLVNLPLPVAAIYTSGKRSLHALVKWPVAAKAEWDAARNVMRSIVCPLGADRAALTAVRLSRLPGCARGKAAQRLLYLDPEPGHDPIRLRLEVRD